MGWCDATANSTINAYVFKDLFAFKAIIDALKVPLCGKSFTADTVSMYTNINTNGEKLDPNPNPTPN